MHSVFSGIVKEIRVLHRDGTSTVLNPFRNLITNSGLDLIGVGPVSTSVSRCHVSTDTSPPLVTDSSVVGAIAFVSAIGGSTNTNSGGSPSWFYEYEQLYTFTLGAVVGNISKLYFTTSSDVVFSSVLIKDLSGDPTTITVTADDQLFITWALRKNVSVTPVSGVISIDVEGVPTDFNYEIKPANLGSTSNTYYFYGQGTAGAVTGGAIAYETQTLGDVTGAPAGSGLAMSATLSSYSNGNFYRDVTYSATTAQANFALGIGSMQYCTVSGTNGYQVSFTPRLPKNSDRNISIPFRISWSRE